MLGRGESCSPKVTGGGGPSSPIASSVLVENVDVGDVISDHAEYERRIPEILARIGLR